jgi:hypothetical protein
MYTTGTSPAFARLAREPDAPYKKSPPGERTALSIAPDTSVTKTLAPGQPGTLSWSHLHGSALVCVRYRESNDGSRRYTTVELVVDERIARKPNASRIVAVTIGFDDVATRQTVMAAGGVWDREHKVWRLPETKAQELRLTYRLIKRSRR